MRAVRIAAAQTEADAREELSFAWRFSQAAIVITLLIQTVYYFSPLHEEVELAEIFGHGFYKIF